MAVEKQEIMRTETGGVFDSVEKLADAIHGLSQRHNVLVPGGAIGGRLPVLHSAAVGFVFIDPQRETYGTGGDGVGLTKSALDRIAAAAGIEPVPHLCGRTDDLRNPHIAECQAVGTVKQLDGTSRLVSASKRIDLRAERDKPVETWGADAQEIKRIADKARGGPRDPWPQIMQQRQHIGSLAESKAWNRMLRKALGIRANYSPADIAKGFAVVRLQFTGRHEDPEVERQVALMVADRALGATAVLYSGASPRHVLPAAHGPVPRLTAATEADDEPSQPPFDPATGEVIEGEGREIIPPAHDDPPPDVDVLGSKGSDGKWTMVRVSSLTLDAIIEKIERTERALAGGKVTRPDEAKAQLGTLQAWKAYREREIPRGDDSTPF
jgi:hypothetical protein